MNTANLVVLTCLIGACSAAPKINVGIEGDAGGVGGNGGGNGHAGAGGNAGFGGGDGNALVAHIEEPPSTMAIEIVTISCADECADVIAVASGGNPGYTFVWNDGVTTAARTLCPSATTTFSVTVTDTAITDDEFHYDAQTVNAHVTAQVLACPTDGGIDSGTPSELCLANLSFEGTPARNLFGTTFDAAPWQVCSLTPDIANTTVDAQYLAASDGQTYLGLLGDGAALTESVGQALCASFAAGASASLRVDIGGDLNASLRVQLFGAASLCGEDQLLAEIDPANHGSYTGWQTHCVDITASRDIDFFKVKATGSAGPYALIDNLRIVERCNE